MYLVWIKSILRLGSIRGHCLLLYGPDTINRGNKRLKSWIDVCAYHHVLWSHILRKSPCEKAHTTPEYANWCFPANDMALVERAMISPETYWVRAICLSFLNIALFSEAPRYEVNSHESGRKLGFHSWSWEHVNKRIILRGLACALQCLSINSQEGSTL